MVDDKPLQLEVEVPNTSKSTLNIIQDNLEKARPRLARTVLKEVLTTIVDIIDDVDNQENAKIKVTVPTVTIVPVSDDRTDVRKETE